jgi:hypothetical protein
VAVKWLDKCTPCKIGTIPMLVRVDGRSSPKVGKWLRVQYDENGKWESVLVRRVDADGYFMADR